MKITAKQYALALYEAVEGKKKKEVEEAIKEFAGILVTNNDITKLEKIIQEFNQIWNEKEGIVEAKVMSSQVLDKSIVKLLNDYIVKLSGAKNVVVNEIVDKDLLGGVVIKYGDKVMDGSLKARLGSLKQKIEK
jgi:F-type H+-transporting ATPase subunit delta